MKTNLTFVALIIGAITLLSSCGSSSYEATKADDMKKVYEVIKPFIKADDKVRRISFFGASTPASVGTEYTGVQIFMDAADGEHNTADITFANIDQAEVKKDRLYVTPPKINVTSKVNSNTPVRGRLLPDYDFSVISSNIQKAMVMVDAIGYQVSGFERYIIHLYEDPKMDKHEFEMLSKAGGTKLQGKKIVTQYYPIKCEADADGNVTILNLEQLKSEKE